ncbi:MAG: AAA family ATPase [Clostridia bacterium]|nr:AAA family ATPase [Clostridia bacterium]
MPLNKIYGNDLVKDLISSQIEQRRLAHTFIIEGPEKSGKTLLAKLIAASMTKNQSDIDKIMSDASPDVMIVDLPEKAKTIGVGAVREIREKAYLIPNDLDYKVFIIEKADSLTVQAQNALLKIIEEPPNETYFILLARSSSSLLPTVRSRAVLLRMQIFSDDEVYSYLVRTDKKAERMDQNDPERLKKAVSRAAGVIGIAKELISSASGSDNKHITEIFLAMKNRDRVALLTALNALPSEREAFTEAITKLRVAIRDSLASIYNENTPRLLLSEEQIVGLSAERLFAADKLVLEIEKRLSINPNIQAAKYYMYTKLV